MEAAVWPHRRVFLTPMAAVAGAVADEVLAAAVANRNLAKAYVNNSGDIAVHLQPGETLRLGIVGDLDRPAIDGTAAIEPGIGGVATSGWRGRSLSFGIADAVTTLAKDAATISAALDSGQACADRLASAGLICGAALILRSELRERRNACAQRLWSRRPGALR